MPDWHRVFSALVAIWLVSIQNIFVEVEKFSSIQKQQSYSLDVVSSEETCIYSRYGYWRTVLIASQALIFLIDTKEICYFVNNKKKQTVFS